MYVVRSHKAVGKQHDKNGVFSNYPCRPLLSFDRSAYLVMLTALSFMIMIATVMVYHAEGVTGREKNVFVKTTVSEKRGDRPSKL